jgi:hypothetical protein
MYSRLLCFNVIINILLCNHYIIIVLCNLTAVIKQIHCVITCDYFDILRLYLLMDKQKTNDWNGICRVRIC